MDHVIRCDKSRGTHVRPYLGAPVALVVEVVAGGVELARVATLRVCRLVAAHRPVDGQPVVAPRHAAHDLLLYLAGGILRDEQPQNRARF